MKKMKRQKTFYIKLERQGKIQLYKNLELLGVKEFKTFHDMSIESEFIMTTVLRCTKHSTFINLHIGLDKP